MFDKFISEFNNLFNDQFLTYILYDYYQIQFLVANSRDVDKSVVDQVNIINADGKLIKQITNKQLAKCYIKKYDDKVFYLDLDEFRELISVDINTLEELYYGDKIGSYKVYNDKIYYTKTGHDIYLCDIITGENIPIISTQYCGYVGYKNYLIFVKDGCIHKINIDDKMCLKNKTTEIIINHASNYRCWTRLKIISDILVVMERERSEEYAIEMLILVDLSTNKILKTFNDVYSPINVGDNIIIFSCDNEHNFVTIYNIVDQTLITQQINEIKHVILHVEYNSEYYICQLTNNTIAILDLNFKLMNVLVNVGELLMP